ncbi:hypothetical protein RTBOTA2_006941 [Rhodotorula toruloides]|nr:hypothetical protein RTBOTA2_006941 [Rhodotorula toruloides]
MQKLVWAQEVLRVGFNVGQDLPEGGVTTLRLRKSGDEAGPPFFVQLVLSLLPSHLCAHLLRFLSFALRSVLVRLPPRAMTAPFRRLNLVSRLRERLLSLQERAERLRHGIVIGNEDHVLVKEQKFIKRWRDVGYACAGGTNESSEMYGTSWSSAPRYGAHGMISSLLKIVPFALYFVKTSFKNSSMTSRGGTHPASAASAHSTSREEEECRTGTATPFADMAIFCGFLYVFTFAPTRNGNECFITECEAPVSTMASKPVWPESEMGTTKGLGYGPPPSISGSHLDPALGNLEENGLETLDRHVRAISTTLAQRPPLGVGLVVVVRIDEASVKLDADLLERPRTRHLAKVDRRHQQVVVEVLRDLATGPSDWVRILKNQRSSACGRLSRPVYFSVISLLKGTRKLRRSGTLRIDPGLGYFLDFFLCTTLNPSYDPDKPSLIEPSESDPSEESPDDEGGPPPSPPPPPAALSRTVSAYDLSALRLIECLAGNLPFSASDSG